MSRPPSREPALGLDEASLAECDGVGATDQRLRTLVERAAEVGGAEGDNSLATAVGERGLVALPVAKGASGEADCVADPL